MFAKKDSILIISAHPDDEVIGCGGTILKAIELGAKVSVLFLGEGVSTRYPNNENSKACKAAIKFREQSALKCLKSLGIRNFKFNHFLCTRFDTYPILNFVRIIENFIGKVKPNIIFTHNESEVNIDHVVTNKATEIACRPISKLSVKKIYAYEAVCSSNFKFKKNFSPDTYVDIKKYIKRKIKALKYYKNEIRNYPFPRSTLGIETQARYRGMQSGLEFAEAFELLRSIE